MTLVGTLQVGDVLGALRSFLWLGGLTALKRTVQLSKQLSEYKQLREKAFAKKRCSSPTRVRTASKRRRRRSSEATKEAPPGRQRGASKFCGSPRNGIIDRAQDDP